MGEIGQAGDVRGAVRRRLERATYRAQKLPFVAHSMVLWQLIPWLAHLDMPPPPHTLLDELRRRRRALIERDFANVAGGLYPRELLFHVPFGAYARVWPALMRDLPRAALRMWRRDFRDLPGDLDPARYPPYYRRTFHWQTDGYLSDHSASIYDVSVEILFMGMADAMRRQIIPPISRHLAGRRRPGVKLLDIACGTGRTLRQLATAHPDIRYHGVDLSPHYIAAARRLLHDVREISLVCENAETLPYVDDYFDVITSVYLFHELPRTARRRVLDAAYRALRPGGLLVLEDSAQQDDAALEYLLDLFPRWLHEPFFRCYMRDDLAALVAARGFEVQSSESHFVSRVVVARKPR